MKWATFSPFFYPYNQVPEKGSTMYFGSCLIIRFYHANMLKWLWRYLHADVSAKVTELLSAGNQFPSVLYFQHANICYISCTPQYDEKPHTFFFFLQADSKDWLSLEWDQKYFLQRQEICHQAHRQESSGMRNAIVNGGDITFHEAKLKSGNSLSVHFIDALHRCSWTALNSLSLCTSEGT